MKVNSFDNQEKFTRVETKVLPSTEIKKWQREVQNEIFEVLLSNNWLSIQSENIQIQAG
jgi:hypothetical protein